MLPLLVRIRFQVLFHSPLRGSFRLSLTVLVSQEYLALEDGPPVFSQDITCPDLLVACSVPLPGFRVRGYHPLSPDFPDRSTNPKAITCRLFPGRSPLLGESRLISFPTGT